MTLLKTAATAAAFTLVALSAQAVTIDDFSDDQAELTSAAIDGIDPGALDSTEATSGAIGPERRITVDATPTATGVANENNIELRAGVNGGTLNIDSVAESVGTVLVEYGNMGFGPFVPAFDVVDLTDGGAFDQLTVDATAFLGDFTIEVEVADSDGTVGSLSQTVNGASAMTIDFLFSLFQVDNAGATAGIDFASIEGLTVLFTLNLGGSSASFDIVQSTSSTVVPLPASGFLLIAGMGGIAFLRRRR
ncbi:MAG: VPLPA-CTERM sorting domain-containing protein [Pseudomonadota bacterium]